MTTRKTKSELEREVADLRALVAAKDALIVELQMRQHGPNLEQLFGRQVPYVPPQPYMRPVSPMNPYGGHGGMCACPQCVSPVICQQQTGSVQELAMQQPGCDNGQLAQQQMNWQNSDMNIGGPPGTPILSGLTFKQ